MSKLVIVRAAETVATREEADEWLDVDQSLPGAPFWSPEEALLSDDGQYQAAMGGRALAERDIVINAAWGDELYQSVSTFRYMMQESDQSGQQSSYTGFRPLNPQGKEPFGQVFKKMQLFNQAFILRPLIMQAMNVLVVASREHTLAYIMGLEQIEDATAPVEELALRTGQMRIYDFIPGEVGERSHLGGMVLESLVLNPVGS
jgi:bisphosphoglycerate-dependent phosphoglycerate mutase